MVAEIIIRLDDFNVVDLRCGKNLPRSLRTRDVRGRAHFTPFLKGAVDAPLRDQPDDERDANEEEPLRPKTVSVNVGQGHVCLDIKRSRGPSPSARGAPTSLGDYIVGMLDCSERSLFIR